MPSGREIDVDSGGVDRTGPTGLCAEAHKNISRVGGALGIRFWPETWGSKRVDGPQDVPWAPVVLIAMRSLSMGGISGKLRAARIDRHEDCTRSLGPPLPLDNPPQWGRMERREGCWNDCRTGSQNRNAEQNSKPRVLEPENRARILHTSGSPTRAAFNTCLTSGGSFGFPPRLASQPHGLTSLAQASLAQTSLAYLSGFPLRLTSPVSLAPRCAAPNEFP